MFGGEATQCKTAQRWLSAVVHGGQALSEEWTRAAANAVRGKAHRFLGRKAQRVKLLFVVKPTASNDGVSRASSMTNGNERLERVNVAASLREAKQKRVDLRCFGSVIDVT